MPVPPTLVRLGFDWLATASRGVQLHTDAAADRFARQHRADAVALGEHIFVRDGRFDPATPEGLALLSHELVHVMQHRNGIGVTSSADHLTGRQYEHEALAVERTVLAVMRPPAGRVTTVSTGPATRAAPQAPAHVVTTRAVPAIPLRAGEERSAEPAAAQGPATDPAELAKEVYRLFERRLRVARERVGMARA